MEASSNPPNNSVSKGHRHYGGLITTLEFIRMIGILGAVIWGFAIGQFNGGLGFITLLLQG